MDKILFDTNILSYHYIKYPDAVSAVQNYVASGSQIILSAVNVAELLAKPGILTDVKKRLTWTHMFLSLMRLYP